MTAPAEVLMVSAAGTVRRLQALAVAGWPMARLARETGITPHRLARLLRATAVPVEIARAVAAVYTRFSTASPGLCGVSHIAAMAARERAAAAGWAPHGAWDDDTIDDPDARPEWTGHCGTTRGADLHERHSIPLCPACEAALYRRRQRNEARALRASSTTT